MVKRNHGAEPHYDDELFALGAYGCGALGLLIHQLVCMDREQEQKSALHDERKVSKTRKENASWY